MGLLPKSTIEEFSNEKGGFLFMKWTYDGKYLTVVGETSPNTVKVCSYNGAGVLTHKINSVDVSGGKKSIDGVTQMHIDVFFSRGMYKVAICPMGTTRLIICDLKAESHTIKDVPRGTGVAKDVDELLWLECANKKPVVAAGTSNGVLMLFDLDKLDFSRPFTKIAKDSQGMMMGCWSEDDNIVALATSKGKLVLRDMQFDMNVADLSLEGKLVQIQIKSFNGDKCVCLVFQHKVNVFPISAPNETIELEYDVDCDVIGCHFLNEGLIVSCFANGMLKMHSIAKGSTARATSVFSGAADDEVGAHYFTFHEKMRIAVVCSGRKLRVFDLSLWRRGSKKLHTKEAVVNLAEEGTGPSEHVTSVEWAGSQPQLAISTNLGRISSFSLQVKLLHASYGKKFAICTAPSELELYDAEKSDGNYESAIHIVLGVLLGDCEVAALFMGPKHIAVSLVGAPSVLKLIPYGGEYHKSKVMTYDVGYKIDAVSMADSKFAVVGEGRMKIYSVNAEDGMDNVYSVEEKGLMISSVIFNGKYVAYGSVQGTLHVVDSDTLVEIHRHTHSKPIARVAANQAFTRVCFVDSSGDCFLILLSFNALLPFPPPSEAAAMDRSIHMIAFSTDDIVNICCQEAIYTYRYTPTGLEKEYVAEISSTPMAFIGDAVCLHQGRVWMMKSDKKMAIFALNVYKTMGNVDPGVYAATNGDMKSDEEILRQRLSDNMLLHNLGDALIDCVKLKDDEAWKKLLELAISRLRIDVIIECYRHLKEPSMVSYYEKIAMYEEINVLKGYVYLSQKRYDDAQQCFIQSSDPRLALKMRRSLLQWDKAIHLAEELDRSEIPIFSVEYAKVLETTGDFEEALAMYEKGMTNGENDFHDRECQKGIARTCVRTGKYVRAMNIANTVDSESLFIECAEILAAQSLYEESAGMYLKARMAEDAVRLLLKAKKYAEAGKHITDVSSKELFREYAAAMEGQKMWKEAADAYEYADDIDRVVELCLTELAVPERAFELVRKHRVAEGAQLCVNYCLKRSKYAEAITFLVIANDPSMAFKIAKEKGLVGEYGEALGDSGTREEYLQLARYFSSTKQYGEAAYYTTKAGVYYDAVQLYLLCGEEHIDELIDIVGKAKSDLITRQVTDFISGRTDAIPKSPKHHYRLHIVLKEFIKASTIAADMARSEMDAGKYKEAHRLLFETHQDLISQGIPVPGNLQQLLFILHSYTLVRDLVKCDDHVGAAYMLLRVLDNIQNFKRHSVEIMVSAMIECSKVGLKRQAFHIALELLKPEHKNSLKDPYRKKVEAIVRKQQKTQIAEPMTPCPFCAAELPEYKLSCGNCKNLVPYCIVSGKHMVKDDWTTCSSCRFTALYSRMSKLAMDDKKCPMCENAILFSSITKTAPSQSQTM